jgi:hypothetical protein
MEVLLVIFSVLVVGIGGFYTVCHIIKLWTGCNDIEAVAKLHNIMNGKVQYQFCNDMGFANEVWKNVRNVIGDKRYQQLVNLSNTAITTQLLSFGENSGLPYIAISMYYADENEKQVLENVLTNLVRCYLQMCGYDTQILVDWKVRYDINMPFLEIRYARTPDEKRILTIGLQNNRQIVMTRNSAVIDDTEDEDLDG